MTEESVHKNIKILGIGVAVGALFIFCWGLWAVPILSHNEARRMVVVQEMLRLGNWLLPTMNGEVYLAKPPLLYWLMAFSCTVFNTQAEWAMRLPSSLMAVALIVFFLWQAGRHLGLGPAVFGAAVLATSLDFIEYARSAQIEMLLTLSCTVSAFCFLDFLKTGQKGWLTIAYAALGFAILSKGPVALIFFVPPALVFGLIGRDTTVWRGLGSIHGWLATLLIALPWFLYIFIEHKALLDQVINEDLAGKVAGVSKSSPIYTYPLFLAGALAPWTLLFFFRPKIQLRKMFASYEQRYFFIYSLVPLLLMTLVSEKHGKYLLPIFPCLAMVLGAWGHDLYCGAVQKHPQRDRLWTGGVGILLAAHFIFQTVLTPRIYDYRFSALKPMATAIKERARKRPVYSHNEEIIQLIYYAGQPLPVKTTQEITALIAVRESFLVVASSKTWKELDASTLCLIEEFSPFLKRDRAARLLGNGDFCPSGLVGKGGSVPP